MSLRVNTNLSALDAFNSLSSVNAKTNTARLRLASQLRINKVSDDTSGFRVGKELGAKVSLMQAAQGNIGSAKDTLATAESALTNINDLLTQISVKVAQATDPTKNLTALANDINALGDEITAIFTNTKFNQTNLLSGSSLPSSSNFVFQTGETEKTTINFGTVNTLDLTSISSSGATSTNITSISISTQQTAVQDALGKIGNYVQRLNVKDDFLTSAVTNAKSGVSRLFDANIAMEQLNATKGQIGEQIATSMLAQLNAQPQTLLALFR